MAITILSKPTDALYYGYVPCYNNQWFVASSSQTASANFGAIAGVKENSTSGNEFGSLLFYANPGSGNLVEFARISSSGNVGIGTTSPNTRLDIDAGAIEFAEMTAPAAGAANTGRLFCRDNSSGKTQLCIIFSDGVIQVIATQP